MLEQLRLLLDIDNASQDDVLLALLEICKQEFCDYCHRDDWDKFENLIVNMATYRYSEIGNERLQSESYSDISFHYADDYPANIQRQLKNCRKLVTF